MKRGLREQVFFGISERAKNAAITRLDKGGI